MNQKLIFTQLIFTVAALLAAGPPALHAQVAAPAAPVSQAVTLRYKFTVGQVHEYQYNMEMNTLLATGQSGAGVPIDTTMHMTMQQTVKSVRPADGAATVVTQIEAMHMLQNGQEVPLPEAQQEKMKQPFTEVLLPNGKILSTEMPALGGSGVPGMDFSKSMFSGTAFLPPGPVKVGDTWNGSGTSPMAGMQMAFLSALTGLTQKNGVTLATIQSNQKGTIDRTMTQGTPVPMKMQGNVTGSATQKFDTAAGMLQSAAGSSGADMTMTFLPPAAGSLPPGMPSAMKMHMTMKYTMELLAGPTAYIPVGPASAPAAQ